MNIVILLTMIKGQSHLVKAENITDVICIERSSCYDRKGSEYMQSDD